MSFQELQARFHRQHHEYVACKLLRVDNISHVLALISDLLVEKSKIILTILIAELNLPHTQRIYRSSDIYKCNFCISILGSTTAY